MTLSLWQKAFSPHHAFGDALKKLGYESFNPDFPQNDSLLENIFGRGYINLERMTDLYYGPMPYTIIAHPRPHTRFDYKKITWTMILHLPMALWSMIKVAWNVSSKRKEWIRQSTEALQAQRLRMIRPLQPSLYTGLSDEELFRLLRNECESFTKEILYWPLLMVVLTESTIQNLRLILSGIFGSDATDRKIRDWMAHGLHTVTLDMSNEMQAAADKIQQANFLSKYGHRGAGEMDLANPRWIELGEKSFQNPSVAKKYSSSSIANEVEIEIQNLKTFKRDIVLDEWKIFKKLLELREQWKMEILKPYAEIRFLLEEIGKRSGLNSDIHWLQIEEVLRIDSTSEQSLLSLSSSNLLIEKIQHRKTKAKVFRSYSLPETLSLEELENVIEGRQLTSTNGFIGEALSPGVSYGEIRFVSDPTQVDLTTWPEQVIIAAQATDPGWTPLFLKAKGIIVERGGVLSHCAIVAREMSIPAISGILNIQSRFKDGDRVWIDGNTGRISKEGVQR